MAEAASRHAGRLPRKASRTVNWATPPIVAVIDREGIVLGIVASRGAARALLQEGAR